MNTIETNDNIVSFPFYGEIMGYHELSGLPVTDRDMDSADWAEYFSSFVGNGIFALPEFAFTVREHKNMTLSVDTGKCWINGYYGNNREISYVDIEPADGLPRIDRVCARWNLIQRKIHLFVIKGEPAVNPVEPALVRTNEIYDLCFADVTVNANAAQITQLYIKDTRLDDYLCGIVVAAVQEASFNTFALQFYAWFKSIRDMLTDDVATNLFNEITKIKIEVMGLGGWAQFVRNGIDMDILKNIGMR